MQNSLFFSALRFVLIDMIGTVFMMPVWWYTTGLKRMGGFYIRSLSDEAEKLALGIWIRHMFVPMYGDYTIAGRAISFFMRVVVLIIRAIIFVLWMSILSVMFLLWLLLPAVAVAGLMFQLS